MSARAFSTDETTTRFDSLRTTMPGLTEFDEERAESMADEGGASGMQMEAQDDPSLEWGSEDFGHERPLPAIVPGIALGLVGAIGLGFVALKLSRRN